MFVPGPWTRTSKAPTELQLAAGLSVFALWGGVEVSMVCGCLGVRPASIGMFACVDDYRTCPLGISMCENRHSFDKFCRTQRIEDGLIESSRTC